MKSKRFSKFIEESPASDLSGDDLIPIVDGDSNVTGHTTVDDLASAIGGGGGEGGEVPASRTITAGTGLTGGGNLSANRTIALSEESIASLGLADSAVQSVVAGSNITINDADPANPVISSTGEGGGPVDWGDVENKPSFADVATSGDYDDLDNKPTLGSAAAASTSDFATASQGSAADTALQETIVYHDGESWPSVVDDGHYRIWVQPDPEGDPPPAGGRPGRAPGDLVFLAQGDD